MSCFRPLFGYPAPPGARDRRLVFSPHRSYAGARPMLVPCGKCVGCHLSRAGDWAVRCVHESKMHAVNSWNTLTFSPEHLPADESVSVRTHQLFMKAVRDEFGEGVRFFMCGEYGTHNVRPHYHYILFGVMFEDRRPWKQGKDGSMMYTSAVLSKLWPYGLAVTSDLSYEAAGYTARYSMDKQTAAASAGYLERSAFDPNGNLRSWQVEPEFVQMSLKPGIGYDWAVKWKCDWFPSNFIVLNGMKRPVPSYYYSILTERERMVIRDMNREHATQDAVVWNSTEPRLAVREKIKQLKADRLKRGLNSEAVA